MFYILNGIQSKINIQLQFLRLIQTMFRFTKAMFMNHLNETKRESLSIWVTQCEALSRSMRWSISHPFIMRRCIHTCKNNKNSCLFLSIEWTFATIFDSHRTKDDLRFINENAASKQWESKWPRDLWRYGFLVGIPLFIHQKNSMKTGQLRLCHWATWESLMKPHQISRAPYS